MKILEIGNYPPPNCGWAVHTNFLVQEVRRRGYKCDVLKINEGRQIKSPEYIDVQDGADYVLKLLRFALRRYQFHVHLNGESPKGFLLAMAAALIGRAAAQPAAITFHGGTPQTYFPRTGFWKVAFKLLFKLVDRILCNDENMKAAIALYGVPPRKISTNALFSPRYLEYQKVDLPSAVEQFLKEHNPIFFCYVSFRQEYELDVLREAMRRFRSEHTSAGFIWLGFPEKEMASARKFIESWPPDEIKGLLLLGNVDHDTFATLLGRCTAKIRTPACDGVSSSVLEALAMGIPVVASENGRRPTGVVTYPAKDAGALVDCLDYVVKNHEELKAGDKAEIPSDENISLAADWLLNRNATTGNVAKAALGR
jgi:glycosyltransferase involved in cell wall biosynthesis